MKTNNISILGFQTIIADFREKLFHLALFGIIVLNSVVFSSCDSEYLIVRKQLSIFENSVIVLPPELLLISKGRVTTISNQKTTKTFFIYFESVDCSDCLANKIASLQKIYTISEENSIDVKCIISPNPDGEGDIIKRLIEMQLPFDLYVDASYSFHEINPSLPYDQRFYMFCTDNEGKPFFVGNPSLNKKYYDLFIKTTKKHLL